jgi:hypothetical protein
MGKRKKNNQIEKQRRLVARLKRNAKRIKRMAKEKTPGQLLHEIMYGSL